MQATLIDGSFDDPGWVFEDKYDGFRMIADIRQGRVTLYSRNAKIISSNYIEVARVPGGRQRRRRGRRRNGRDGKYGVSHFQLLQNALRHEAKLLYCAFELMFENGEDIRRLLCWSGKSASGPSCRVDVQIFEFPHPVLRNLALHSST